MPSVGVRTYERNGVCKCACVCGCGCVFVFHLVLRAGLVRASSETPSLPCFPAARSIDERYVAASGAVAEAVGAAPGVRC